jgi:ThiF family
MQTIIKIPHSLFRQALNDLNRPHPFAMERVGFFSTRCSRFKSTLLVHCIGYTPVEDGHYIYDDTVGVRIGPQAITAAMTRSLTGGVGQIHVHAHGGRGLPSPSGIDSDELPPLLRSLNNANSSAAHGWMILSDSDAWASISLDGNLVTEYPPEVSLIGFPLVANRRTKYRSVEEKPCFLSRFFGGLHKKENRYDRQSFLGPDSEAIIASTVIGIVGLGGGGSHINQQLTHLGFRNFVYCDPDTVSGTNLNRMVNATQADVRRKRLKVNIAERYVKGLHKDASITKIAGRWEDAVEHLAGCDLIFGCLDSFGARRDLEAFSRRHMIPLIDVGMDVIGDLGNYEIVGQVILSMPGCPCMHCTGFLNPDVLGREAQHYGAAGGKPQVVWSNGMLCSAAVGIAVDLLTNWSGMTREPVYLGFSGSQLEMHKDKRMPILRGMPCPHYPSTDVGDAQIRLL